MSIRAKRVAIPAAGRIFTITSRYVSIMDEGIGTRDTGDGVETTAPRHHDG